MPNVHCPRCGADMNTQFHWYVRGSEIVFVACRCGPLAVVEGERVTWYYPQAWLLDLARKPAVVDALVDEALSKYIIAHPEARS